ncbi:MAG: ribonuclease III [Planctomycetia bacterium]|nr:ribonuclease III [Planctomycetia bacterium]
MTNREDSLLQCQKLLKYTFKDPQLLKTALTHASCAATHKDSNERLEYLGDSVLGLVIADYLYNDCPECDEGELSAIKGSIVSRQTCNRIGRKLGLERYLSVARGISPLPDSMVANLIEAILGAVYLDAGFDRTKEFAVNLFNEEMESLKVVRDSNNFKAALQNWVQQHMPGVAVVYQTLDEKGPAHRRCFKIGVALEQRTFQAAWGATKKETEQRAAENALSALLGQEPPYPDGDH